MTLQEAEGLARAGFRYYAFISYPNTDAQLRQFARRCWRHLEGKLAQNLPCLTDGEPRQYVFLDAVSIREGALWEPALSKGICESVAMIALCVPMYAHPQHAWCGREWAAMEELARQRLPGGPNPIFPVRLGELDLPSEITRIQVCDLSRRRLERIHLTTEFDRCLSAAVRHIRAVGEALLAAGAGAVDCGQRLLPVQSAFGRTTAPTLPNRSEYP